MNIYEKKNEKLAEDIKIFLIKNNIAMDIKLYFNNKSYSWYKEEYYNKEPKVREDDLGSKYFEFANDEGVSMSFEGPLYHILNYSKNKKLLKEFDKIFTKHNCYYEFGYAWSLSVYYN